MVKLNETLNWEVQKSPVFISVPDSSNLQQVKNKTALLRSDSKEMLSIVSSTYQPIKNSFLIDTIGRLSESTGMEIVGYDEFNNGKAVIGYLHNKEASHLAGYKADHYMAVGNFHNANRSMFIGNVGRIHRCKNMFSSIAVDQRVRHSANYKEEVDEILAYYDSYMIERIKQDETFTKWRNIPVDQKLREAMIERVLRIELGQEEVSPRMAGMINDLQLSIDGEMADMGDNLFGLFNGVTHWTTHKRAVRNQVFGNILGSNFVANSRAFAFAEHIASN